ncbi:MAG: type II toxin-antitoxin system RelE family toxin [Desulfobaccales bacterium]
MNLIFKKSFAKDLKKIRDKSVLGRLRELIQEMETTANLQDIGGLQKISRESAHYRLRLGEYRLGLIIEDDTVTFVRFLHRKEIYRYFP